MINQWLHSVICFCERPFVRYVRVAQFFIAVAIFTYAAVAPGSQLDTSGISDVYLHFTGNVLLFLSAWVACFGRLRLSLLLVFLVPYSLLVELSQWLSPGRMVDAKDVLVNMLGLAFGLAVTYVIEWCGKNIASGGS